MLIKQWIVFICLGLVYCYILANRQAANQRIICIMPNDQSVRVCGRCVQVLYEKGGRKFGFLSLSPLGCLPALRALNPKASEDGGCLEEACALALAHNNALSTVLRSLEHMMKGFKYSNSNFYNWLHDRINNPSKYGEPALN